jgi:hypothetical protein
MGGRPQHVRVVLYPPCVHFAPIQEFEGMYVIDLDGRHVRIRTGDLYRVKVASS